MPPINPAIIFDNYRCAIFDIDIRIRFVIVKDIAVFKTKWMDRCQNGTVVADEHIISDGDPVFIKYAEIEIGIGIQSHLDVRSEIKLDRPLKIHPFAVSRHKFFQNHLALFAVRFRNLILSLA